MQRQLPHIKSKTCRHSEDTQKEFATMIIRVGLGKLHKTVLCFSPTAQ